MSKKYAMFITGLFLLFIFGFAIAFWIVPDRDFSQQENRTLAQLKAPTLRTLKSGQFMSDFEDYVIDQFPLRDRWVQAKAWSERLLGKTENNGVYLGTDSQTLFAQYTAPGDLAQRVGYVNALADHVEVPVAFSLVPDKSFARADLLPAHAPLTDDGSDAAVAAALCGETVQYIDLYAVDWGEDAFYRTDHHWTTMGAYQGYLALSTALTGSVTLLDSDPIPVSDAFYGTTWSSAGTAWVEPDEMHIWIPDDGSIAVTRWPGGLTGDWVQTGLYDSTKLLAKDKYAMFLGGNAPLTVLKNPVGSGKLLIVRDSYADSLAPFFAQDWAEVHLWDLRYNLSSLSTYIREEGIDQVLILYSAAGFATDASLPLMGL